MAHRDTLGAFHFAGAGVGTVAEAEFVHLGDHGLGPACSLGTSLRKQSEGTHPCSYKEHSRTVLAGSNASTATYTCCSIHALLSLVVRYEDVVCILCRARTYCDETSCLENLVESAAVHDEVLDDRECGTPPRLDSNGGSVLEMTHKELAGSNLIVRSVCTAVDVE